MRKQEPEPILTYREFLDFVSAKSERFEFVDGHAVAMGIPSNEHQDLALELGSALRDHMRGQRCRVRLAARLWTGKNERAPDIIITCDERDVSNETDTNRYPKLVVEILSPNRGDDVGLKLDEYQAMTTIEEYVIIDSTKRFVRRYYRNAAGRFEFDPSHISGIVKLSSVGYDIDVDALYGEIGL